MGFLFGVHRKVHSFSSLQFFTSLYIHIVLYRTFSESIDCRNDNKLKLNMAVGPHHFKKTETLAGIELARVSFF